MLKLIASPHIGMASTPMPAQRLAVLALLALGVSLGATAASNANPGIQGGQPPAPGGQPGAQGPQDQNENEVQQVLAKFGEFMKHEKYGDVWKPTQVVQGWRPYEPCHWVYNQEMKSWFFDDKTEWGAIVHHYGRWTLDQQQGWLWVPGSEFGPGWVSWEMRGNEVGWAPLPPEQDGAIVETAAFKGDSNLWIFVAFDTLGKSCGAGAPPPPQPRAMLPATGGYVSGGYVAGGYVPQRIVIVNGCASHPRWCHYWPKHHWQWLRPHHRPQLGEHHPGGHRPTGGTRPGGPNPNGPNTGGKPQGPDQKCGIAGQFCKPGQQAGPKPPFASNCRASWCSPAAQKVKHNQAGRFVNHGPRIGNRFAMQQQRFNHRPVHMQQRTMAPRHNFAPRMNHGGGMRVAGHQMRRR